ncbi:hypothetical protein POJ06DRAFT_200892 [Lipomyces tetrasporus]|uniref:Zn(2)-C6 fungal-type domain-containing protein n=1 Tax=Lipomyces tetrasporus TaxID=54092 RepID=A0AAD7VPT9_9ASCO|nr:uncharacterized protein POJ06DRAFT_200892 [Lipomyces tetrasporus]KAJ8098182.1 hypothetical protein POJ06DRAFT_200892 [Lipomyces tetrasporus]
MESKFSVYGSGQKIKRNRKITICQNCYKRRVKCDRARPQCGKCQSLALSCEYSVPDELDSVTGSGLGASEKKQKKADVGFLSLDVETGESRYANSAFWASFFKETPEIDDALLANDLGSEGKATFPARANDSVMIKRLLFTYLPDKTTADDLVDYYFHTVHPLVPVLDRQQTYYLYDKFWESYASNDTSFGSFVCVLFAIFYGACMSRNEQLKYSPGEPRLLATDVGRQALLRYSAALDSALGICKFPSYPSMWCLTAASMRISYLRRNDTTADTVSYVALLARVGQLMGLHRDPVVFKDKNLSPEECNFRRRIWWQLIYLDATSSLTSSLSSAIQAHQYDVQIPDENWELEEDQLCQIFGNGRALMTRFFSRELSDIYGIDQPSSHTVASLNKELNECLADVQRRIKKIKNMTFAVRSPKSSLDALRRFQQYSCILLDLIYEKLLCLQHHPSLATANGSEGGGTRASGAQSAMKVIKLYRQSVAFPDFKDFTWWMNVNHQFHAIIIVLRDIYHFPNCSTSLSMDADDRIKLVEDAIEATEYLRMNEISVSVRQQWNKILRVKDMVWKTKLRPEIDNAIHDGVSVNPEPPTMALFPESTSPGFGDSAGPGDDGRDIVEQLLNLDAWDVDWASFGFPV